MITYSQILQGIEDALVKQAFIPAPGGQQQPQGGGQPGGSPQGGSPGGSSPNQPDPQMIQQAQQQAAQQQAAQQGPPAGGDLTPHEQPQDLKNTKVTMSVADLLDLHSGGKATQSHLKTESMKVKHQFEHQKMLREERAKQEEEQQKKQQEAMMQQQQQQGMMGGGIYGGGQMGQQPGQAGQTPAPAQPQQPAQQPGVM